MEHLPTGDQSLVWRLAPAATALNCSSKIDRLVCRARGPYSKADCCPGIRMRLVFAALLLAQAPSLPSPARPPSHFDALLLSARDSVEGEVALVAVPGKQFIARLVPLDSHVALRLEFNCATSNDGRLVNCKSGRMFPSNPSVIPVMTAIWSRMRVSRSDAANVNAQGGRVFISAFLNDPRRNLDASCPQNWCPQLPRPPRA